MIDRLKEMKKSTKKQGNSKPESALVEELDERTTHAINLQLLQGKDPSIESIICQASHVTVYTFNADLQQWVSTDNVEFKLVTLPCVYVHILIVYTLTESEWPFYPL